MFVNDLKKEIIGFGSSDLSGIGTALYFKVPATTAAILLFKILKQKIEFSL
jgi:hypothetical protein